MDMESRVLVLNTVQFIEVIVGLAVGFALIAAFRHLIAEAWRILVETWNAPLWKPRHARRRQRAQRTGHGWTARPPSRTFSRWEEVFDDEED